MTMFAKATIVSPRLRPMRSRGVGACVILLRATRVNEGVRGKQPHAKGGQAGRRGGGGGAHQVLLVHVLRVHLLVVLRMLGVLAAVLLRKKLLLLRGRQAVVVLLHDKPTAGNACSHAGAHGVRRVPSRSNAPPTAVQLPSRPLVSLCVCVRVCVRARVLGVVDRFAPAAAGRRAALASGDRASWAAVKRHAPANDAHSVGYHGVYVGYQAPRVTEQEHAGHTRHTLG